MAGKAGRSGFGNIRKIMGACFLVCVYAFAPVQSAHTQNMVTHIPCKHKNKNCFALFMSH